MKIPFLLCDFTRIIYLLFMIFLLGATGCNSQKMQSAWAPDKIEIDGQMQDWSGNQTTYFEDEDILMGLANDSQNLYLLVRFNDPQWARMIKMSGLTVWIDPDGGKDKIFGLRYTGGPSMEDFQQRQGDSARTMPEGENQFPGMDRFKDKMKERPEFAVVDSKSEQIVPIPKDGSKGPSAEFYSDGGFYNYEFSVPLELISADFYGLELKPGQKIGIGSIWGGSDRDEIRNEMGGGPGGKTGGGPGGGMGGSPPSGGGPGGGMGGGPPGGGMRGERPNMPEKQEYWFDITLAQNAGENKE